MISSLSIFDRCVSPKLPPFRHLKTSGNLKPAPFLLATMSSTHDQTFPPQHQDLQPGKEHVMDPAPDALPRNYKSAEKLLGKSVLITGGDSGIGRAVCLHFALEGASVAFTYANSDEVKDANDTLHLLNQLKAPTAKAPLAFPTDAGFEENCRKVVEAAAAHFGGAIDILVNNAAEQHVSHSITDITEEQLERVFRTNIFSYFYC